MNNKIKPITKKQKRVLDFMLEFHANNRFWPSLREIAAALSVASPNGINRLIDALIARQILTKKPGQKRAYSLNPSFRIINDSSANQTDLSIPPQTVEVTSIPIYGSIPAGYPDKVESADVVGRLQVDVQTLGLRSNIKLKTFALKVKGDSMIDAGIFDGDMVIVEPTNSPKDGDIVAALIDNETTLKRLIIDQSGIPYLKAENQNYPELYPANELIIQGIAKSVVRSLS